LAKTIRDYHLPFCNVKLLLNGEMIGNCFFFKKDNNTKIKKNASFFWFLLGKERGRISPCWPIIGILLQRLQPLSHFLVQPFAGSIVLD